MHTFTNVLSQDTVGGHYLVKLINSINPLQEIFPLILEITMAPIQCYLKFLTELYKNKLSLKAT